MMGKIAVGSKALTMVWGRRPATLWPISAPIRPRGDAASRAAPRPPLHITDDGNGIHDAEFLVPATPAEADRC